MSENNEFLKALGHAVGDLYDTYESVQDRAALMVAKLALNGVYDVRCMPRLIELLNQEKTRESACLALVRMADLHIFDPACIDGALAMMRSDDINQKRLAIILISALARNDCLDPRCSSLMGEMVMDQEVGMMAYYSLTKMAMRGMYDPSTLTIALEMLIDTNEEVKRNGIGLIGSLAMNGVIESRCLPLIYETLPNMSARLTSSGTLLCLYEKGAFDNRSLDAAKELLVDGDPRVRSLAAMQIAALSKQHLDVRDCLPGIMTLLDDESTCEGACFALSQMARVRICDCYCLDKVIEISMNEKSEQMHSAKELLCYLALCGVYDKRCPDLIAGLMSDSNDRTVFDACEASIMMAYSGVIGDSSLRNAVSILDHDNPSIRCHAATLVSALAMKGYTDQVSSMPKLMRLLDDQNARVRATAILPIIMHLPRLNPKGREVVLNKFHEMRYDEDGTVREVATRALNEI